MNEIQQMILNELNDEQEEVYHKLISNSHSLPQAYLSGQWFDALPLKYRHVLAYLLLMRNKHCCHCAHCSSQSGSITHVLCVLTNCTGSEKMELLIDIQSCALNLFENTTL